MTEATKWQQNVPFAWPHHPISIWDVKRSSPALGIMAVYCTVTRNWQMFCMLLSKPSGKLSAVVGNGRAGRQLDAAVAFTLDESRFLPNSTVTRFAYEIKPSPFSPPGAAVSRIHLTSSPPAHAGPKGYLPSATLNCTITYFSSLC